MVVQTTEIRKVLHSAASGCNGRLSALDCIGVEHTRNPQAATPILDGYWEVLSHHRETGIDSDVVSSEQPSALPHEGLVAFGLVPECRIPHLQLTCFTRVLRLVQCAGNLEQLVEQDCQAILQSWSRQPVYVSGQECKGGARLPSNLAILVSKRQTSRRASGEQDCSNLAVLVSNTDKLNKWGK